MSCAWEASLGPVSVAQAPSVSPGFLGRTCFPSSELGLLDASVVVISPMEGAGALWSCSDTWKRTEPVKTRSGCMPDGWNTARLSALNVCVSSDSCFLPLWDCSDCPPELLQLGKMLSWPKPGDQHPVNTSFMGEKEARGELSWTKYIPHNRNSSVIQRWSLLSLVRGSLQHERDFQQSVVILKLRQHLQQEDNGSVHMRCKTSRAINLIYWNTPDALQEGEKKRSRIWSWVWLRQTTNKTMFSANWTRHSQTCCCAQIGHRG